MIKRERTESKERNDREERRTQGKQRFGKVDCLITNSSVEVGYGFMLFHSKLLIANDMYWVVL